MSTLNILLVEDNLYIRDLTGLMLRKAGHRVTLAANGEEALKAMSTDDFDLVLMDIEMPGMNGLAACRIIRQCEQGRAAGEYRALAAKLSAGKSRARIPIVALSGNGMPDEQQRYLEAGMDECLIKPFNIVDFSTVLHKINKNGGPPKSVP